MRQSQRSDRTVECRVRVEEGERKEAPYFNDASLAGSHQVLAIPRQDNAVDAVRMRHVSQELSIHRVRDHVALVVVDGGESLAR